jgi:hypothetical protein
MMEGEPGHKSESLYGEVSLRSVVLMDVMRWMQWQWQWQWLCSVVLARLGLGHASVMDRIIISINIRSW